jgi:uncharacterized membrane protein
MSTEIREFGPGTMFLVGVGVGAGLMYLYDPDRGARRRGMARDKVTHLIREGSDVTGKAVRDLENRARGLAARARAGLAAGEVPDDAKLVERIRAHVGRWVSNPGSIEVSVHDGRVVLSGPIFRSELDALVRRVRRVRGVREVEHRLQAHELGAHVPGLQREPQPGARSRWFSDTWPPSMRLIAACASAAGGAYGLRRGDSLGNVLAGTGAAILIRAITNLSARQITGIGAGRRAVELHKTMTIDASLAEVFEFWTRFENFPRFMEHVREVNVSDDGLHSHWVLEAPAGTALACDVEVTALEPNKVLAWKTLPGASVEHAGIIHFAAVDERRTRIDIQMSYNPIAGAIGHTVARIFRKDPKTAMNEDLLRLKSLLEGRGIPRPLKHGHVSATPLEL